MEQIQILLRDRDEGASNDCASSGLKAPCVLYVRNANKIQLPVMARCSSPCIFLIKQTWVIGPGHCLCMKPLALTSILDLTITPSARKLLQLKERERTDENYVIHNSRSAILLSICVCVCVFSCFQLLVTPWIIASQALLSMEFSRQEYWNGLPFSYSSLSICTYPKNVNLSHFTSLASYCVFLNNLIKPFKFVLWTLMFHGLWVR